MSWLSQEADIGIGGISMTYQRSQAVEYSKIYSFETLTFITKANGYKSSPLLILEPFTTALWISILISLISVIIFQRFIVYKIIKNRSSDITWPLISAFLKQGKL